MAQYYFEFGFVSRTGGTSAKPYGRSAIAKAAYDSREKLQDARTGEPYDYRYKGMAEETFIFLPKDAPVWMRNRQQLWQELENREDSSTRPDQAQLSRTFKIAIPAELDTPEKRRFFTLDYGKVMARQGYVVDMAIHAPEGTDPNWHLHAQLALREVTPDGFGKKIRLNGEEWNRNSKNEMQHQKEVFVKLAAQHLRRYGHTLEADRFLHAHKTLEKQLEEAERRGDWDWAKQLDREPTIHMGPAATAMERKGIPTRKGDINREIKSRNYARQNGHDWSRANDAELANDQTQDVWDRDNPARESPWQEARNNIRETWERARKEGQPVVFWNDLAKHDLQLVRVTKEEAVLYAEKHEDAKQHDKYSPKLKEGEYVVVNDRMNIFRLTPQTTGDTFKEIQAFLKPLDASHFDGITKAWERADAKAAEFQARQEAFARINDPTPTRKRGRTPYAPTDRPAATAMDAARETARRAGKGIEFAANGRTLGKLGDMVGGLLEGVAAKKLTPKQKAEGRMADAEKDAAVSDASRARDWASEAAERDHRNQGRDR